MQAMILAAGLGTRLLPHTLIKPKPLFPILNKPLLLLVIKRLKSLGFDHIIVNCHHLGEQVVEILRAVPSVTVQHEEIILGTGGGLRGAFGQLRDEPLLVINGDIYHTIDFIKLYDSHLQGGGPVTLATHDYPRFNSVNVRGNRVVSFDNSTDTAMLAFTGIHVIAPELLETIRENEYSCIIDHYRKLLKNDILISSHRVDGCFWTDIGTPEDYLNLHEGLLTGTVPRWKEFGEITAPFCIAKDAILTDSAELRGWACIGNSFLGTGVQLEKSVVWDNVSVPDDSRVDNRIISS